MRVIGGIYRHRQLVYPDSNPHIRPTKDRIREAFFSIVGPLDDKTFLDLYAGSGSMGIEAISRGASKSYFVDSSKEALSYAKENIMKLDIASSCEVYQMKDMDALEQFVSNKTQFDVIYLDPPYELGEYEKVISYILNNGLLKEEGILAAEINRKLEINPLWNKSVKEYHYGEISIYVLKEK